MMMEYFNLNVFLGSMFNGFIILIVMKNLLNITKVNCKNFTISFLILGIYIYTSYLLTNNFSRMIILFLVIIISGYFCYRKNSVSIQKIIFYSFIEFTMMLIAEMLCSVLLSLFWHTLNNDNLKQVLGNTMINSMVMFLYVFLIYILVILRKRYKLKKSINSFTGRYLIFYTLVSVILFCITFYVCFQTNNRNLVFIINFTSIIIYSIIIFKMFSIKSDKEKIQSEYDILVKNLNEYENLLDLQRVTNHENKNQLLVIKGMIDKGESNTSEYINSIIDTQYKDNDAIIYKTNRIPSGGLRGLIYYKILTMKEKKINSNLDVDRSLNELDFDNIPIKTNQELCKIVGVFLDNAIQAVSELKKKEIDIYLKYENDELYIKVSNNYSGVIELDKIDNSGYTTKGKGHGYGLSLVKGIIRENDRFKNDREIHGKMFSQIIRLKINED